MRIPEPGGYMRENAVTFGSGTLCPQCGKPLGDSQLRHDRTCDACAKAAYQRIKDEDRARRKR